MNFKTVQFLGHLTSLDDEAMLLKSVEYFLALEIGSIGVRSGVRPQRRLQPAGADILSVHKMRSGVRSEAAFGPGACPHFTDHHLTDPRLVGIDLHVPLGREKHHQPPPFDDLSQPPPLPPNVDDDESHQSPPETSKTRIAALRAKLKIRRRTRHLPHAESHRRARLRTDQTGAEVPTVFLPLKIPRNGV